MRFKLDVLILFCNLINPLVLTQATNSVASSSRQTVSVDDGTKVFSSRGSVDLEDMTLAGQRQHCRGKDCEEILVEM